MSAKRLTERYDDLKKGKKLFADIEAQLQEGVSWILKLHLNDFMPFGTFPMKVYTHHPPSIVPHA